ncbi:MAG TPA: CpsB/CapC family capsule biosynthesis tyrosine phosphatase, partial [Solirubrobacterales bacterium]|nr:CpsB/CapC family capsule biosynthesis tyrosine phosphatase [Solirubrobacterales bacterium]
MATTEMIDLHCHILPGLDDGARDIDDSVAMARVAAADGIEAVCATPHIRHDHAVRVEEIAGRIDALNSRLAQEGIAVAILPGGEVAETAVEALSVEELSRVGLGAGRWVLLEPAPGPLTDSLTRRVAHLAERGYRALIAHPERHLSADMFERLAALVVEGALIQATADFFLREETADGMLAMAEAGLVHVLSSDAHTALAGRPLRLGPSIERLRAVEILEPRLEWMVQTAPRAI